jgi:hypothetical protein
MRSDNIKQQKKTASLWNVLTNIKYNYCVSGRYPPEDGDGIRCLKRCVF